MILMIDNYDSFTYNLVQMIGIIQPDITVEYNDKITLSDIESMKPSHIVISPGPGSPEQSGISMEMIQCFHQEIPILGICLGHQAICQSMGGRIIHAKRARHGKQTNIHIANGNPLFNGLPPIIKGACYHSLIADNSCLPTELMVIAEDETGNVMGVHVKDTKTFGLQFHPESILSEYGSTIIRNFLEVTI